MLALSNGASPLGAHREPEVYRLLWGVKLKGQQLHLSLAVMSCCSKTFIPGAVY